MMGIIPPENCGVFRTNFVHINNSSVELAPPDLVPELMNQLCHSFPKVVLNVDDYDPILTAAQVLRDFVIAHPYADGNGKVSRLLMNLVLWHPFLPIFLRVGKRGRKKFRYGFKRASWGDTKALASVIALSLIDIYDTLLQILNEHPNSQ